jgi:hypothetical protein
MCVESWDRKYPNGGLSASAQERKASEIIMSTNKGPKYINNCILVRTMGTPRRIPTQTIIFPWDLLLSACYFGCTGRMFSLDVIDEWWQGSA